MQEAKSDPAVNAGQRASRMGMSGVVGGLAPVGLGVLTSHEWFLKSGSRAVWFSSALATMCWLWQTHLGYTSDSSFKICVLKIKKKKVISICKLKSPMTKCFCEILFKF